MKKFKIFLAIAIASIATVAAGFYSYQATQENLLAQVELAALEANIEALTQGEGVALMPPSLVSGSSQSVKLVHVSCYSHVKTPELPKQPNEYSVYPICGDGASNQPCTAWGYGEVADDSGQGQCYQYESAN